MINITNKRFIKIIIFISLLLFFIILGLFLFLKFKSKPSSNYYKVSFCNITFLEKDLNILDFIQPFKESCNIFQKKDSNIVVTSQPVITTVKDWQVVCSKFSNANFNSKEDLILFVKNNFQPYLVKGKKETHFTGYYRMQLEGSLKKDNEYKYPIYKIPKDLVEVKVGDFNKDLKGNTIFGKVSNNKLVPYYTREDISKGILENKDLELVWLKNKYDVFLLHIQGSGVIKLNNSNKKMYISYAAKNGFPFKGITTYMKQLGYLTNYKGGFEAFYEFFNKNPDKIDEVLNQNPSYIFFKEVDKNSWHASLGTNPYAERTIAIDPKYITLGLPLLINMPVKNNKTTNEVIRLVVANDTGSAIKGLGRIDFYWGLGNKAGNKAINTNTKGDLYLLLPK